MKKKSIEEQLTKIDCNSDEWSALKYGNAISFSGVENSLLFGWSTENKRIKADDVEQLIWEKFPTIDGSVDVVRFTGRQLGEEFAGNGLVYFATSVIIYDSGIGKE